MRKLLLLSSALFALGFGAKAQTAVTYTTITDTLIYFENKEHYRNPNKAAGPGVFDYYRAPSTNINGNYQYLTHCGSIFLNQDSITVTGLLGWMKLAPGSSGRAQGVDVRIEICDINPTTGLPQLPSFAHTTIKLKLGDGHPHLEGGPLIGGPKLVNRTNFAILMRNMSTAAGDTVYFYRTNAHVLYSASDPELQFGEGLGVVSRTQNQNFSKTTDYDQLPSQLFGGHGTDFEFCVAPIVELYLKTSQIVPEELSFAPGGCVGKWYDYVNTSSPSFTNRQFNQNEFYRRWKPFATQPQPYGFYPEDPIVWVFGDDNRLDTVPYHWGRIPNTVLDQGTNIAGKWFDTASVPDPIYPLPPPPYDDHFNGNFFANYKKMNSTSGYGARFRGSDTLITYVDWCNHTSDEMGIKENTLNKVKIYPNPAANGKTTISGLEGKNTVTVYNMLGQMVSSDVSDKEIYVVDLFNQPQGAYLIRVVNDAQRSKSIRIINQKD